MECEAPLRVSFMGFMDDRGEGPAPRGPVTGTGFALVAEKRSLGEISHGGRDIFGADAFASSKSPDPLQPTTEHRVLPAPAGLSGGGARCVPQLIRGWLPADVLGGVGVKETPLWPLKARRSQRGAVLAAHTPLPLPMSKITFLNVYMFEYDPVDRGASIGRDFG